MKSLIASMLVAGSLCGIAHAEPMLAGETAYPKIAIGYDALMAGENERAAREMLDGNISRHDPGFLLNLGQAYARSGRIDEARELFRKAARKRDAIDLVLANGSVIDSRQAARQALATVQVGIAAR